MTLTTLAATVLLAVPGTTNGLHAARTPVTNAEYAQFVQETHAAAPRYWKDGKFPQGKDNHPVLWVSAEEAQDYCAWLSKKDPKWTYRLPTEAEWELAAGPSKQGKFNFNGVVARHFLEKDPKRLVTYVHPKSKENGKSHKLEEVISATPDGRVRGWVNHRDYTGFIYTDLFRELNDVGGYTTAVDTYKDTVSAAGCLDMWGNCWEWTSSLIVARNGAERGKSVNAIKGGSWYANKNSCRTEYRGEGRRPGGRYNTVGFRVFATPTRGTRE